MRMRRLVTAGAALAVAGTGLGVLTPMTASALGAPDLVYGLTKGKRIVQFDRDTPGTIIKTTAITGLPSGVAILSIDIRPATGALIGLGSNSTLYSLDPTSGAASSPVALAVALPATPLTIDFNPVVDRLRVIGEDASNRRYHPDTGALVAADTALAYAAGDPNVGTAPDVVAAAYTNNVPGAGTTVLYDLDKATNDLATQNPPNAGQLNTVGDAGQALTSDTGFDIAGDGAALASTLVGTVDKLHTVTLGTGALSAGVAIGGSDPVVDIAAAAGPTDLLYGVDGAGDLLAIPRGNPAGVTKIGPLRGARGEKIIAIDRRPATGEMYGLGARYDLYKINLANATTTLVSATPLPIGTALLGFDFNPAVDRIRIVTAARQNLRVHPDTGALVATDGQATYAAGDPGDGIRPFVGGVAYTNNVAGAMSTVLYAIDYGRDVLTIQNPPNAGTLTTVGPLGLAFDSAVGFDVVRLSPTTEAAYAVVNGKTLGLIDLTTGRFSAIGNIGTKIQIGAFSQ